MSGEIVTENDTGRHNANLELSTSRVIEGATWKKQNIVMVLPASKMVAAKCALSWMTLVFPPNNGVARWLVQGMEIGDAYTKAFQEIVDSPQFGDWQYILTVEHDNIPPQNGVLELVRLMDEYPEYDAISGLYWTKGESGQPQIWGDINDPVVNYRPQPPKGGVQECYGIGMGFALWRISMFKDPHLKRPWFSTIAGENGVGTQDLYFWGKARPLGHRCAVACDVRVGHYDSVREISW